MTVGPPSRRTRRMRCWRLRVTPPRATSSRWRLRPACEKQKFCKTVLVCTPLRLILLRSTYSSNNLINLLCVDPLAINFIYAAGPLALKRHTHCIVYISKQRPRHNVHYYSFRARSHIGSIMSTPNLRSPSSSSDLPPQTASGSRLNLNVTHMFVSFVKNEHNI